MPYEKVGKNEPVCIVDEVPFDIPDSWEWCTLASATEQIHYGYTASATPMGDAKLARITDIQDNKIIWESVPYCSISKENLPKYKLKNRDILIARTGGTIGKTYIIRNLNENAVFASYLIRAIPLQLVNEEYLKLFMESPLYWEQLKTYSMGTGQPNVNGKSLSKLRLPLPPLNEQQKIVEKIKELEPYINDYNKAYEKIEKLNTDFPDLLKKSILQEAVQGKLVPQDNNDEPASVLIKQIRKEKEQLIKDKKIKKDKNESCIFRRDNSHYEKIGTQERCIDNEIPFDIPDSWEWTRLGNVINLTSGQDLTPDMYNTNKKGIPYITGASNIEKGEVIINRWTDMGRAFAYKGNLLLTCKGTVGKIAILSEEKVHIARQVMGIYAYSQIYIEYIKIFLESYINTLKSKAKSMIPGISREDVLNILFPLPPVNEQQRIADKVNQLLPQISKF